MAWRSMTATGDGGDASAPLALPPWGSVLQDKYVNARVVACCPTMDLIAILTADRQLQVHRTISWQRIVHVKPSEVFFTMETLAWSPDGMRLAVGCDEGELVVFSMATAGDDKGVEIKPHTSDDDALHHQTAVVAMHWVAVRDTENSASAAPPSAVLRNRTAEFTTAGASDTAAVSRVEGTSVLVTADAAGRLGIWWNGLVLVAMLPLQEHWRAKQQETVAEPLELTVHSVMLASDLSALFVDVSQRATRENEGSAQRQVLRLDLSTSLQTVRLDLGAISRVGYEVRSILERVRTSLRQMTSEWKNATRVFELKMSLIGSLYEKYGYEEPPQVDMLAIIAGGIASPAVAQYFAQDIQEMSIIRMQKMLTSGCETIQQLLDAKIKNGLQQILFEVAELRGAVKWKHRIFSHTLGITTHELDDVVDNTRNMLTAMEQLGKVLHETRQDLSLFLKWLLERIRIHTNDTSSRANAAATPSSPGNGMHESLLNVRRLVAFLERAAQSAKAFQEKKNKFLVEVTFGNPVSQLFSSQNFIQNVDAVDRQWSDIMMKMLRSLSTAVDPERGVGLRLGDDVDEVHLHTRWAELAHEQGGVGEEPDSDDEDVGVGDEEEEFDIMEAVDWDSLGSVRDEKENLARARTPVVVIAARYKHRITLFTSHEGSYDLGWRAANLELRFMPRVAVFPRISFYGGTSGGKRERMVVAANGLDGRDGSLYIVDYDPSMSKLPRSAATSAVLLSPMNAPTVAMDGSRDVKYRPIRSSSAESGSQFAVITQASRGVVCVIAGNTRVVVLDAEEDPEDEEGGDESPGEDGDSEDHDEGDL